MRLPGRLVVLVLVATALSGCPGSGSPLGRLDADADARSDEESYSELFPDGDSTFRDVLDIGDISQELNPEVVQPDSGSIMLHSCPRQHMDVDIAWDQRPSSLIRCYYPEAVQDVPQGSLGECLPWEVCHLGYNPDPEGLFVCLKECKTGVPCPLGGDCSALPIQNSEGEQAFHGCTGGDRSSVPEYPEAGDQPAEGGLNCWTPVADLGFLPAQRTMAVVAGFVYILSWEWGVSPEGHWGGIQKLTRVPAAAPLVPESVVTLLEASTDERIWTRVLASGSHLILLERIAPDPLTPWLVPDEPVLNIVLAGIPDVQGNVDFKDSGLRFNVNGDLAAPVPGSDHGCLLYRRIADLSFLCFPEADGHITLQEHAVHAPSGVMAYLDWYRLNRDDFSPIQNGSWTAALSADWLGIIVGDACSGAPGRVLHHVSFSQAAMAAKGTWNSRKIDGIWPRCATNRLAVAVGDTVLLDQMTTRLAADSYGSWRVASRFPPGFQRVSAWAVWDGYLWMVDQHDGYGARLWVNRVEW